MTGHEREEEIARLLEGLPRPEFRARLRAEVTGIRATRARRGRWSVPRLIATSGLGVAMTLALFLVMDLLVTLRETPPEQITGTVVSFLDVDDETEAIPKARSRPRRPDNATAPRPPAIDAIPAERPSELGIEVYIEEGTTPLTGLVLGSSDMDEVPLVRIEPRYPPRAESLGIEGWVIVEFTISTAGTVIDPEVIDSHPLRVFDSAARRAVARWKYRPRVVDGAPIIREGVQVVLTFEMNKDA